MIEYRIIDREHAADIRLKNEPFELTGRLIPALKDGKWSYSVTEVAEKGEMCFPDENYDYDEMQKDHLFIGAYDDGNCVGLAVMAESMFRYLCLDDLKVDRAYRGKGIGTGLVRQALEAAKEKGYIGIYAVCQDNNLRAARFYLKAGFEIGGFDNRVYQGTKQADKADILFYLDI